MDGSCQVDVQLLLTLRPRRLRLLSLVPSTLNPRVVDEDVDVGVVGSGLLEEAEPIRLHPGVRHVVVGHAVHPEAALRRLQLRLPSAANENSTAPLYQILR